MIIPLKRWLQRLKFIVLLVALSYLLYHILTVVNAWIEPEKYREPGGRAVKVFQQNPLASGIENETVLEKLQLFYWYGE